jgi:uncharacterized RDD family membrane protein YckC
MDDTRYKTFWRRFGALFIDGMIFQAVNVAIPETDRNSSLRLVVLVSAIGLLPIIYSTVMHARFGQTVGKMAAGVMVLDLSETRGPSWTQSLQRDSLSYGFAVATFVLTAMSISMDNEGDRLAVIVFGFGLMFALLAWSFGEILSTLINSRRRSFHDLIAGTVVVKLNQLTPSEMDSILTTLPSRRKVSAAPARESADTSPEPVNRGW